MVTSLSDPKSEMCGKGTRAGTRLNSRVAIAVEWTESGRELRAEGHTVDVSPKGCLAIVAQVFHVGDHLRIVNLTNQSKCDAVLIWRGHQGRTGWELGLELRDAPAEFWDVDF